MSFSVGMKYTPSVRYTVRPRSLGHRKFSVLLRGKRYLYYCIRPFLEKKKQKKKEKKKSASFSAREGRAEVIEKRTVDGSLLTRLFFFSL